MDKELLSDLGGGISMTSKRLAQYEVYCALCSSVARFYVRENAELVAKQVYDRDQPQHGPHLVREVSPVGME